MSFADEDLSAPPLTTARAWAIAERDSSSVIASEHGDVPQKSASTTKIMCAHVILEQARVKPAILDEWVTVSKLADSTVGSTAGVKAGERVTVRDALYGLLLPSGNDMGNALAEHFNARMTAPAEESPPALREPAYRTRCNFIAAMNKSAVRMGMKNTRYLLPFGDGGTLEDRTTTAHDLLRLAREAMNDPLFRQIVNTQSHTATITTPAKTTREATWTNTNPLLKLGIYDGIKTGMTKSAGYCLVASGEQNGKRLIAVVLGCTSEASRATDTRNLFRWAWARLQPPVPAQ